MTMHSPADFSEKICSLKIVNEKNKYLKFHVLSTHVGNQIDQRISTENRCVDSRVLSEY